MTLRYARAMKHAAPSRLILKKGSKTTCVVHTAMRNAALTQQNAAHKATSAIWLMGLVTQYLLK